jgi:predicted alpha/beta superfamily hydrolase
MRRITITTFLCLLAVAVSPARAEQKLHVVIHAPSSTPKTDSLYLAGSLPSVGGWKADGVKLTHQDNGTYTSDIDLTAGKTLEFKITRGSWASVEKYADGSDRPNRQVTVDATTKQIDVTVARWASDDQSTLPAGTVVGNLKLHNLDSKVLKQPRTIRVWLPPGYEANVKDRFGVLYMHDGQNCFDRRTSAFGNEWEIDETLTKLIGEKRVPPLMVVAIDNGGANRINELTYTAEAKRGGGQGSLYADFLLNEVKPFIDRTYRTNPGSANTFIGGSSLGGLASLEIARRHPSTFAGVIAMSPTILWADELMVNEVKSDPNGLAGTRVWIDMGTREGTLGSNDGTSNVQSQRYVDAAHRLDQILTKSRIEHRLMIDNQHASHSEPAWASRFPQAIAYILNAN